MGEFVVGVCCAVLIVLIVTWEGEADRRFTERIDINIPLKGVRYDRRRRS